MNINKAASGYLILKTILEGGEETAGVKTEAGNRIIPIHKTLIDLGLLEYRDDVMRHKHRRLFPDLNRTGRGIYGAQPGKQFGTIVAEVVPEPKGKTFYSLRHNFAIFMQGTIYRMQNSDSFSGTVLRRLQKNSMASLPNLTCFTMNSLKS